jgi:hypothetical protein
VGISTPKRGTKFSLADLSTLALIWSMTALEMQVRIADQVVDWSRTQKSGRCQSSSSPSLILRMVIANVFLSSPARAGKWPGLIGALEEAFHFFGRAGARLRSQRAQLHTSMFKGATGGEGGKISVYRPYSHGFTEIHDTPAPEAQAVLAA